MNRYAAGAVAGLAATVLLSALMLLKSSLGMLPQFNAIAMLAGMANQYAGLPATPMVGWVIHLLIGTLLWGLLFAWLEPRIPGGADTVRGILFSIGTWVLMMVIVMPLAGVGLFGLQTGLPVPVATLVLHIIFGVVLGATYGVLMHRAPGQAATAAR